jgi:hypothetical protein
MDKKALELCARFTLQPNELGYCGTTSASAKLKKCILKGKCDGLEEEFESFIVLNPYLETIAKATGKDKFSYEVIESYWLGNDLLKEIKPDHYQDLIKNLTSQGIPKFLTKEISKKIPKSFIPVHLFNILHIGVGKASGSVPFNLKSINNCMIRWGNVLDQKINKSTKTCTVKITQLDKEWKLTETIEEVGIDHALTPDLKTDDSIAIHWGFVAKKLSDKELTNLIIWTQNLLNSLKNK